MLGQDPLKSVQNSNKRDLIGEKYQALTFLNELGKKVMKVLNFKLMIRR